MNTPDFSATYVTLRTEGDRAVAAFTISHLTDEENVEQIGHELFSIVDHLQFNKVVVSLDGVEYMTSSVMGKLIMLHRRLHRSEGGMVLCDLGAYITEVLRGSRLLEYFHVCDTVDQGLEQLRTIG